MPQKSSVKQPEPEPIPVEEEIVEEVSPEEDVTTDEEAVPEGSCGRSNCTRSCS